MKLDVSRIRRGDIRLGHQEGGPNFTVHQGFQPLLLLRWVAILGNHLHVARVWRRAVHRLRGDDRLAHVLSHQSILEIGETGRFGIVTLGEKQIP